MNKSIKLSKLTVINCSSCNDLLFLDEVRVDNKRYPKTSFILYESKAKQKAFCSFQCKHESDLSLLGGI